MSHPVTSGDLNPTMDDTRGPVARRLQSTFGRFGTPMLLVGAVLLIASAFLSWSYVANVLGDLTVTGYPAPMQIFAIVLGVVAVIVVLAQSRLRNHLNWVDTGRALGAVGVGALAFVAAILASIAWVGGGLINVEPGGWLALVGALLMAIGGVVAPVIPHKDPLRAQTRNWIGILVIIVLLAVALFGAAYALGLDDNDPASFLCFAVFVAALCVTLSRAGFFSWLSVVAAHNRQVLMLGAAVVAVAFPFTQNGSDANMSIAAQVLIFAVTALGLNIVVGLAGLLDLGYIAFLGTGAYVAAMMSESAAATIGWKPNFLVVVLIGACTAALLGLIIGSPTLRVSGDYLAIVTLAFGEIFRIVMNNLDGQNGPDLTHGSNSIAGIPDLQIGSFNFGDSHEIFGVTIGRFANYYFVLLLLAAIVITIFNRLNNSRIGRGWIAIREDERAAEAMGVNVFGLKLFAFASGAFLAGMAGTIRAHQDGAVTPQNFEFLESAFLLAAIVLGGMGTVAGVMIGATILRFLPEKLRFLQDYRLLMFGILLVLMMRFRPEGLIPSGRRALEFHEEDETLADKVELSHVEKVS